MRIVGLRDGTWLSFHGLPAQILARGADTAGAYTISRAVAPPGGGAPPHAHTFDEGFYLLRGELTFTAGHEKLVARAGDFLNIRGGEGHFPLNHTSEDAEIVVVAAPAGFDDFQIAVSVPAPGPEGPFAPAPADIAQRFAAAAPKFGIEMRPAPELFQRAPQITLRRAGAGETLAAVGDVYRFLATGAETAGRYAIWHARIFPGGGPPPHIHTREEEAFFILRGTLAAYDDGVRAEAGPGSLIILPRGSRHWFKNESDTAVEMLVLIAPAGGEELFRQFGRPWDEPERAPEITPGEIARLGAIAPDFGIVLDRH